ncbi:MAG: GtrA family protein [bacterium]
MTWLVQIKKYATVGIGSAITDLSIYGSLVHFAGFSPEAANLISRPCGGLVSFTFNKIWTFDRSTISGTHREFIRFGIVWVASYCASILLVWLFHQFFIRNPGLPAGLSEIVQHLSGYTLNLETVLPKLFAEGLVCTGIFLSHRFWTFRQH